MNRPPDAPITARELRARIMKLALGIVAAIAISGEAAGQLIDKTVYPNTPNVGIAKSYPQQIGAGRGNVMTPNSSLFLIKRDPFRAIRRGRQIFQRRFTRDQGQGPVTGDGPLDPTSLTTNSRAIGAGLMDSCAGCHGNVKGGAAAGGAIHTTPGGRNAPHLFGVGLKAMLGEEITLDLWAIRDRAIADAKRQKRAVELPLRSKGIDFGTIKAFPNGDVDTSGVRGVGPNLQILTFNLGGHAGADPALKPFFVGAFNGEMGLEAVDEDIRSFYQTGHTVITPAGLRIQGINIEESPCRNDPNCDHDGDGVANEVPQSIVDFMEFYLLNYFKPALGRQDATTREGERLLRDIGCTECHRQNLQIDRDLRVADVETVYDPVRGNPFNNLFATATALFHEVDDGSSHPTLKLPNEDPFLVRNIFTDFRTHDLGPNFHEQKWDGSIETESLTTPLWGVGSTAAYGQDGKSPTLEDVILRHGGEAQGARNAFAQLSDRSRHAILAYLNSLILFGPDETASNLLPKNANDPLYPIKGQGAISLTVLFNNPNDPE
ncbi:MAG TPA: di-heme oxidoredictase family protein [Thermoanaerobaculia bacterium]|nr:di-heme oxidoredictase family protein [Thermoanaerobaculia bacterium]